MASGSEVVPAGQAAERPDTDHLDRDERDHCRGQTVEWRWERFECPVLLGRVCPRDGITHERVREHAVDDERLVIDSEVV